MDDAAFLAFAQERLVGASAGWPARQAMCPYPVRRVAAGALVAERAVLVGNAAQTSGIHPIGAQGFNLGLRDALTLAELVAAGGDPGAPRTCCGVR